MACDMESASTPHRALHGRGLKRFVVEQVAQPLRSRSSRARGFAAYDAKDVQIGVYATSEAAIAAVAEYAGGYIGKMAAHNPEAAPADAETGALIRRHR